jgi:hypothetical protein
MRKAPGTPLDAGLGLDRSSNYNPPMEMRPRADSGGVTRAVGTYRTVCTGRGVKRKRKIRIRKRIKSKIKRKIWTPAHHEHCCA